MSFFWLFLFTICRKWVLSKYSYNKLLLNQLFFLIKTLLIFFLNSEGLEFVIMMLVSPANKIGLNISDINFGRSIIYSRKNNSPSIEPYGTPCLTGYHLEEYFIELLFNTTL
jgi:hypothetical protein